MKQRSKLIVIFSVAFAVMGLWTVLVFSEIKGEHDIMLALAQPYEWIDQYRPLTANESNALLRKVKLDELEDQDLLIMSYRASLVDSKGIVKDTDRYKIWKSADCFELKLLAVQHSLRISSFDVNGKHVYVVVDEGRVWNKGMDDVRSFADSEAVKAQCPDLLSMHRFSGAHASPSVY